ncbi:MAG: glutamyl-tRNA reductase [Desulfovibrio sp.]|jgi:glutamyl-tRNA reductase|nr:glutamyl-tRNA reductase [Desulfovibrio sp.]
MDCTLFLLGLNHRTAGVDVRERFSLANHCDQEHWALPCTGAIHEAMILSTCNRVELLATGVGNGREQMLQYWANAAVADISELTPYIYIHENLEAVRHLFTVASSLDSMVLGEPQILGQLKTAYRKAVECKATGVILNRLLHMAFSAAKRVRNETAVASNAVSISYAAVELAKRIFGDMRTQKVLLVGAGEMAELAATHLLQTGVSEIFVTNRTYARGQALAEQFRGRAFPFDQLAGCLTDVDIVITSTGSEEPLLNARAIKSVLKTRKNRPMFFIDIAVPRDIDPDVNNLDNVYLYDIDDLKEIVEENMASRRDEAAKAALIVDEEVASFARWLSNLDVQPTIVDLIKRNERIARNELAKTLKRLGQVDDKERMALEAMVNALMRKLNHDPIMFLKRGGMSQEDSARRVGILRRIYNLDNAPDNGEESNALLYD